MIAAIAAHAAHSALGALAHPAAPAGQAFGQGTASQASDGQDRSKEAGSIAADLGRLGADVLGLLGLGGGTTAAQGAAAYAQTGRLVGAP